MAWSWSHNPEAYQDAHDQFNALPRETRNVIAAEWLAAIPHPRWGIGFHAELDERKYHHSLARVAAWTDERLDEYCWPRIDELATCDNGGWNAHCCPFGCMSHFVPFEPVTE